MTDRRVELRSYCEEEARLALRPPLRGGRAELREEFEALLASEDRLSVLDFGSGPGRDGEALVADGHRYVGIDLALGNCVLGAKAGITVVQASITAPPFRSRSFDAGWSMSTVMHLAEGEATEAVRAMASALRPGAPLVVGVWGGELGSVTDDWTIVGEKRPFSLRSVARNREIFAACGSVDRVST